MSVYKTIIPDKHYLGLSKKSTGVPFAAMVPYGTDSSAKKRMATITGSSYTNITIDNLPMVGFKLTGLISSGGDRVNDSWQVEDPRGFSHNVTSPYIGKLIADTTIENGIISSSCVWAREGSNNILLSTDSEIYQSAVNSTELTKSSIKWSDIKLGNEIAMQNGITGKYLGKYYLLIIDRYKSPSDSPNLTNSIVCSQKASYIISTEKNGIEIINSVRPSKIISFDEITQSNAEIELNEKNISYNVIAASPEIISSSNWKIKLIEDENPTQLDIRAGKFVARTKTNKLVKLVGSYTNKANELGGSIIVEDEIANGILAYETQKSLTNYSRTVKWVETYIAFDHSVVTNYYKLYIEFVTPTGNVISCPCFG